MFASEFTIYICTFLFFFFFFFVLLTIKNSKLLSSESGIRFADLETLKFESKAYYSAEPRGSRCYNMKRMTGQKAAELIERPHVALLNS